MIDRRSLMAMALAGAVALPAGAARRGTSALKNIQKRIGGRLGVHVLDSQSGEHFALNDDERFAMASTFKLMLATALLWQVDRGAFLPTHTLPIDKSDLLEHSPAVEQMLAQGHAGMTVRDLCMAAVTLSDNAAANILLKGIGGPQALTAFARSIGDEVTRFDRMEPDLNSNLPGDQRDTTTPQAMAVNMLKIFTQDVLSLAARALLIDWMTAARTGLNRIRAGLPRSWQSGDKTGTGANGAFNDLAVTWPPGRRPILAAVYMSGSTKSAQELAAAQAEIGTLITREKWP